MNRACRARLCVVAIALAFCLSPGAVFAQRFPEERVTFSAFDGKPLQAFLLRPRQEGTHPAHLAQ